MHPVFAGEGHVVKGLIALHGTDFGFVLSFAVFSLSSRQNSGAAA